MPEQSQRSEYRKVFKATGVFGGAQVFLILINILRAKAIALLLGTQGFGIYNLFLSPITLISQISGLGIPFSAVRDISYAHASNNRELLSKTVISFRRLVWLTGALGALTIIILSTQLSQWTFKANDRSFEFILASAVIFFTAVSSGQLAFLRGIRRIKDAAIATVLSHFFGLIASLPFYFFLGNEGIVPSLVIGAVATLIVSYLFARRIKLEPTSITWKDSFLLGLDMIKIGFLVTISGIVTQAIGWGIYLFISRIGGLSEVGLYAAGWSMTNQYTGMVFSAMGADYLPRLAAIKDDNKKISEVANQQSEIALLILCPAMILFLSILPIAIKILFTSEFLTIIVFVRWMLLGMMLKTVSWVLGFLVLGKGDSKIFLYTEVGIKFVSLPSYLAGYYFFGLEGVGIAFCIVYIAYLLLMSIVCIRCYDFKFSHEHIKVFANSLLFTIMAFIPLYVWGFPVAYGSGIAVFLISSIYSLYELNKKIDIFSYLMKIKNKFVASK